MAGAGDDEQLPHHDRVQGSREVVALRELASDTAERVALELGLDPFGDDDKVERGGQRDDRGCEGPVGGARVDRGDEAPVDLEDVDGELMEIAERRVAGAEVIDGDPHSEGAERAEREDAPVGVAHECRLGDLEHEGRRGEPRLLEHERNSVDEIGLDELHGRDVDTDRKGSVRAMFELPRPDLPAGGQQHPISELDDQSVLLGERDEGVGPDRAALGVVPSGERLGTDDAAQ